MRRKNTSPQEMIIDRFTDEGSAFARVNEREWRIWGALPGETIAVAPIKKRKGVRFARDPHIITSSSHRITPLEPNHFLTCSPWQILAPEHELDYKKNLGAQIFAPLNHQFFENPTIKYDGRFWGYRNKMEFSFTDDDSGNLSLAFFQRMGKRKVPIEKCLLALDNINVAAGHLLYLLASHGVASEQLKSLIVRSDQKNNVSLELFVRDASFDPTPFLDLPFSDYAIYFSSPLSPASIVSSTLFKKGDLCLAESIMGKTLRYGAGSFFQINVPMFTMTLEVMRFYASNEHVSDLYCGVGSISIALSDQIAGANLIELDPQAISYARENIVRNGLQDRFIAECKTSEDALEYVTSKRVVILDPPRAGLHPKLIQRINQALPKRIVYLSCNPVTQVRDLRLLLADYTPVFFNLYNFFPRTPHLESLVVLERTS